MTARVTQQVLVVGYSTNPAARVTSVALEVIRSTGSNPATASKPQIIVVASGS